MKKNILVLASVFSLLYFTVVIYSSYNNIVFSNLLGAIFELITIPLLLVTLTLFVFSVKDWYAERFRIKSYNAFSSILLTITLVLVVFSTIYNI